MTNTMDLVDISILQLLQKDAMITHTEIAKRIGKSVSPVNERVKRLKEAGFIKAYIAQVDRRKLGQSLVAFTSVTLNDHSEKSLTAFEREVMKINVVMECYHMTGAFDFFLKVVLRDMDDYYSFIISQLAKLDNVRTVQSVFVLHEAKMETAYSLKHVDMGKKKK